LAKFIAQQQQQQQQQEREEASAAPARGGSAFMGGDDGEEKKCSSSSSSSAAAAAGTYGRSVSSSSSSNNALSSRARALAAQAALVTLEDLQELVLFADANADGKLDQDELLAAYAAFAHPTVQIHPGRFESQIIDKVRHGEKRTTAEKEAHL
jgi:hypothetical protein